MGRKIFCVSCGRLIARDMWGGLKGDEFKDGIRCYECSDTKRGVTT